MATLIHAACNTCSHRWQATEYGYAFGMLSGKFPDDFEWRSCPRCLLGVVTPTKADRTTWSKWLATTARVDCGLTPFAHEVLGRIESQLPPDGSSVQVELNDLLCPSCRQRLERSSGDYERWTIYCPTCKARTGNVVSLDCEAAQGEPHPF
jgi:hypothetical protein